MQQIIKKALDAAVARALAVRGEAPMRFGAGSGMRFGAGSG
jgi:hypothetical protein